MNTIIVGDRVKITQSDEVREKQFVGKTGIVVAISIDEERVNVVHYHKHILGESINNLTVEDRRNIYAAVLVKFDCRFSKIGLARVHNDFECWYDDNFDGFELDGHIGTSACQLEVFKRNKALDMFIE